MRYPIFIPSRGRSKTCVTARKLDEEGISYVLVVEPREFTTYIDQKFKGMIMSLDENDAGLAYSKKYIVDYCRKRKHDYHWCVDDDIGSMVKLVDDELPENDSHLKKISFETAFSEMETEFNDMFPQLEKPMAVGGPSYVQAGRQWDPRKYVYNRHVGTLVLVNSFAKHNYDVTFRARQDINFTIENLLAGMCTVRLCHYLFRSSTMGQGVGIGGNQELYRTDVPEALARKIEQKWPEFCEVNFDNSAGDPRIRVNWRLLDKIIGERNANPKA